MPDWPQSQSSRGWPVPEEATVAYDLSPAAIREGVHHDAWCTRYLDFDSPEEAGDACDCVAKYLLAIADRIEDRKSVV